MSKKTAKPKALPKHHVYKLTAMARKASDDAYELINTLCEELLGGSVNSDMDLESKWEMLPEGAMKNAIEMAVEGMDAFGTVSGWMKNIVKAEQPKAAK